MRAAAGVRGGGDVARRGGEFKKQREASGADGVSSKPAEHCGCFPPGEDNG